MMTQCEHLTNRHIEPIHSHCSRIVINQPKTRRRLDDFTADQWRASVSETLEDAMLKAQDIVFDLVGKGGGVLLVVVPECDGDGAWHAAIAGLHGLVRAIAKEYGRAGIRCNLLVGDRPAIERLLVENTAITGEMLVVCEGTWGASGLERM